MVNLGAVGTWEVRSLVRKKNIREKGTGPWVMKHSPYLGLGRASPGSFRKGLRNKVELEPDCEDQK